MEASWRVMRELRGGRCHSPPAGTRRLPLWLTEAEAEALLMLCAASFADAGSLEADLLARLRDTLRAFAKADETACR
jgi:hypothetical protein